MGANDRINLGIVGACGRGASFRLACDVHKDRVGVHAVCDIDRKGLAAAKEGLGADEAYEDYEEMLEKSDLDAVIIGTPMSLHVPQSVAALRRGKHVLCEVPAGVGIDECRELVQACKAGDAVYMMAENYTYGKSNVMVREMVHRGLFGTVYYAEGEYLHELKLLNEITTWRRRWQTGINGVTYGTHSLGPILQWFAGQRVVSVCCAGSGHHYTDPRGQEYENEDTCVMLCKMSGGGLVKIRVDMLSDRPHNMTGYSLQGTDGCYESARGLGDRDKVWLRSRRCKSEEPKDRHNFDSDYEWKDLMSFDVDYLPDWYIEGMATAQRAGHGGGDYFEILDFLDAVDGKRQCPIGIHEAMDMALPGLISQQAIQGDRWLDVPDSRDW